MSKEIECSQYLGPHEERDDRLEIHGLEARWVEAQHIMHHLAAHGGRQAEMQGEKEISPWVVLMLLGSQEPEGRVFMGFLYV
jgi:hypothetical protein